MNTSKALVTQSEFVKRSTISPTHGVMPTFIFKFILNLKRNIKATWTYQVAASSGKTDQKNSKGWF